MFYEIGVLKNFVKFTRKYLYQSLIFDKVPLRKMRIKCMCFHMKFWKFLRTTLSCNTSAGFLLNVAKLKENNKYNYKLNGTKQNSNLKLFSLFVIYCIQGRKNINVICETWFPGFHQNKSLNKYIVFSKNYHFLLEYLFMKKT